MTIHQTLLQILSMAVKARQPQSISRYRARRLRFQYLEARQLLAADIAGLGSDEPENLVSALVAEGEDPGSWTNSPEPCDVNSSGQVTALDALLVINAINNSGSGLMDNVSPAYTAPYLDTNADGFLTPLDALIVINYINSHLGDVEITTIEFTDSSITVNGNGASVDGNVVTINAEGTFRLSGSSADARVVVNTTSDTQVNLQFNNLALTSSNYAPVYVASTGTTFVELLDGTVNTLADSTTYALGNATVPNGAFFSNGDLIFSGGGSLTVTAKYKLGIVSQSDLTINSGNIAVTSKDHGILGRDSIVINGGTIAVTSGGDGIQSFNDVESDKGYIVINGGTITIASAKDGIQAETALTIHGGHVTASSTGKGLTAGTDVLIDDGVIELTNSGAAGRGVDADGNVNFVGGITTINLSGATVLSTSGSGFKPSYPTGVKANGSINVSGTASVSIAGTATATGARGLSGASITIGGGRVTTDLAGGGSGFVNTSGIQDAYRTAGLSSDTTIDVTGGTINLIASGIGGRGFKADGAITIRGGTTTVSLSGGTLLTPSGSGFDTSYPTGLSSDATITMSSGSLTVNGTAAASGARGLSADLAINITGGTINVLLAGNGATYTNSTGAVDSYSAAAFSSDLAINITGGNVTTSSSGTGGKGLKSDGSLTIGSSSSNPTVTITTTGSRFLESGTDYNHPKTIVADGAIIIMSGTITLNSTDDGIHSDTSITISGGTNTINAISSIQGVGEGVEAPIINFTGGVTNIVASNDGINATYGTVAGGTESNDGSQVNISGGIIIVTGSDAIDSNGNITISGGVTIVDGPATGVEEGIDVNGNLTINGGTLISGGSNSPMTKAASSGSTQVNFLLKSSTALASSSLLHIEDSSGTEILTYKPKYNATYFHVSTPALAKGTTYSVYFGGTYSGGSYLGGLTNWGLLTGGTWLSTSATLKKTFTSSVSSSVNTITM